MDAIVQDLITTLSYSTTVDIYVDQCGDTVELESDKFTMTFVIEDERFEIHSIDVRGNSGLGRSVVDVVHDFCDDCGLEVCACKVKPEAQGFWIAMGYAEGSDGSEYYRVN